jgi:hypothetical protein
MPLNGRIVKGRIDSRGSKPTLRLIDENGTLRLDWEDVPEAWLEIDVEQLMSALATTTTTTTTTTVTTTTTTEEADAEQPTPVVHQTATDEPAYADFASTGNPKYSATQYGAYADWFRGPESEPMPPMEAFGPEMQ